MRLPDRLRIAATAILRYPLRSSMLLLAIAIGVAAVLVLTALGEGARRFITAEFKSLGTHLLIVSPGKSEVGGLGGIAGAMTGTPRDLTLGDAIAIARSRHIARIAPLVPGSARINYRGLERDVDVLGTSAAIREIRDYRLASGRFLPEIDLDTAAWVAVLGDTLNRELFRGENALGQWVRVGDRRLRVIGVLRQAGMVGGLNVDEAVFMPVASAMQLFNNERINRLLVEAVSAQAMTAAGEDIVETVKTRHFGHDDVTVITQDAVLETFNGIFLAVTAALAGIAAVSLAVAGTLIMNVMLVAVSQRTEEIGLIKALGATRAQIVALFLTEAALLSACGAAVGVAAGQGGIGILRGLYPTVDFQTPGWALVAAVVLALVSGIAFGILPARRAARLDPVVALSG